MSIGTNDPHAMNKWLYAIDVALVGKSEAPKRWQIRSQLFPDWQDAVNAVQLKHWPECRRDPSAPALPSWKWREAPQLAENHPPTAWFEATADMTRDEYEALQRLARGEAVEADREGWVNWYGGCCPLPDFEQRVEIITRSNIKKTRDAGSLVWSHGNNPNPYDIIAYRVIESASDKPADGGVLSGAYERAKAIVDAFESGESPQAFEYKQSGRWHDCTTWDGIALNDTVRRKPKTCHLIDANGIWHEWPEPMREPPKKGARVWIACPGHKDVASIKWTGDLFDMRHLEQGFVHATRESAVKLRDALVAASAVRATDV